MKEDNMEQAEDHVNEMWDKGLCLNCGKHNDNKDHNLRICKECEEKGNDSSGDDFAVSRGK